MTAVFDRRRSSQQPQSGQGRVELPSLRPGHRCSAEPSSSATANAVRAHCSEGDHVICIGLADLVLQSIFRARLCPGRQLSTGMPRARAVAVVARKGLGTAGRGAPDVRGRQPAASCDHNTLMRVAA